jgi:ketosteroid isomerase-like protein
VAAHASRRGLGLYSAGDDIALRSVFAKLVLGEGDDVLALVVLDFTAKATGKRLRATETMHFTFDRAGRIVRYRPIFDTAERIAAHGA